jgi:uncharacterized protein
MLNQDLPAWSNPAHGDLQTSHRNTLLDVLRGIAVLGGLFIGIWMFGGFTNNTQNNLLLQHHGGNFWLFKGVSIALFGKMSALICIVFGAGMVLFFSKQKAKGAEPSTELFVRRQLWLIIFGLINAFVFLFTNDFLFHLGVVGLLLFPLVRFEARSLLVGAVLLTAIYSGKYYWNYSEDKTAYNKYAAAIAFEKKAKTDSAAKSKASAVAVKRDTLTREQKRDKQNWTGIAGRFKPDPKRDEDNNKSMRESSYGKTWNYMLGNIKSREAQWTYRFGIWDLASMMLLGMFLLKIGFFNKRFSSQRIILLTITTLAVGFLLGWYRLYLQQLAIQDYEKFVKAQWIPHNFFFPFEKGLIAFGYVGIVMLFLQAAWLRTFWNGMQKVGKMALSIYLLQSILCTIYFAGFGMGYFGRLPQYQLYVFAAQVNLLLIGYAVIWLKYFQLGPAEWLLKCLMKKKWLPNRISQDPTSTTVIA